MAPSRDGKSIDSYRARRDFARTPEPGPDVRPARGDAPVFVVHRHDASRLHYDLRLEMEGVLRSWAVPKGFRYDPTVKHLAVRTEDHPLDYEDFHGVIPAGEYGAGSMTIWDRGRYEVVAAADGPSAVVSGELKVVLHGRRLRGEWHLVKTAQGEDTWLLFKSRDRYARAPRDAVAGLDLTAAVERPLPRSVRLMEPADQRDPFRDPAWAFEAAFAGRRVLAEKRGEATRFRGLRRGRLADLEVDLVSLGAGSALLDGVLVVIGDDGRPDRDALRAALAARRPRGVVYYAFDLLHEDGLDLRPLPLRDRKTVLRAVLPPGSESLLYVDHVSGDGERLAEAVAAAGVGGVIGKRLDAAYTAGPSRDWCRLRLEAGPPRRPVAEVLAAGARGGRRGRVRISNPGKVFWPAEGFTKADLLGWYERAADVLLPYLRGRPVHMNRFPDGIEGKSFYQRFANEHVPDWMTTVEIDSGSGTERFVVVEDADALLFLVNLGSIDLHPWMSHAASPAEPDYAVIDLDPKEAPFSDVVTIARATGRLLEAIGLSACVKTSGATGLHVHVGLAPGYRYEQSRMFCEGVARAVTRELPDIATVERSPGKRGGRVYVDFGQNGQGQTVVPPYVVRPVPGATVSMPLAWDELDDDLHPSRFTIQTAGDRIERLGDLFAPTLHDRQDLLDAAGRLQELLAG